MRVLVIGGTAFMGRALVERLLARGDDVTILHRGATTPFGDRVAQVRCDRNDVAAIRAALKGQRFEVVFDNVYDFQRGTPGDAVRAAAEATRPGRRYVFTSSIAVYAHGGDENAPLVTDDSPNVYGVQKAASERALFDLHREQGAHVTTVRPAFVYGPHNPFDREAFFWDRILSGRPVIVPDDGDREMQWVHADDVARASLAAVDTDDADGRAYNLAGPPITQVEFVRTLARVAGREVELVHVARESLLAAGGSLTTPPLYFGEYLDLPPLLVDSRRAREELGFEPRPLDDGLRETFDWYRRQARPKPDFSWEDGILAT